MNRPGVWQGMAYLGLLVAGIIAFLGIQWVGQGLVAPDIGEAGLNAHEAHGNSVPLMLHILLTLTVVVAVGNLLGRLCQAIGQPPVIGEVLAGIALGPSLLGAFSPEALQMLIPPTSVDPGGVVNASLKSIAGLGVVLYMFMVGLDLDAAKLKDRAHSAVAISHSSIVIPFVLGAALAIGMYPRLSHAGVSFTSFSMFCGVAMSITAFPVLARILTDRKIHKTYLGTIALGCAAADDVTAWCLLAVVVGFVQSNLTDAAYVLAGSLIYVIVMMLLVRPWLRRWAGRLEKSGETLPNHTLAIMIALILLSAFTTEWIGIHALFGAFLLGAILPAGSKLAREFLLRVQAPVQILLLPAFFAYTGMRTQIGLLSSYEHWIWCLIIIVVATAGKFGGTLFAARLSGETWRDSAALGTLMNTRGLMELIVLNIGLDLGVISPLLFTMMVIMAIVTTVTTAPALRLFQTPETWQTTASQAA